ncbi:MAG: putative universal stress protein UspA and related nucleotide-binding protein [Rhodospirillales bacterium]|nr:putative universal stress protein UspA and related nucleotide-binding protein [Rhodospirillales bacterium]
MSLRTLLVPITGQAADEIVLDAAFSLARSFHAHISVACIRPNPTAVVQYAVEWSYPILLDSAIATAEHHSVAVGRRAAAMFERWRLCHQLPIVSKPAQSIGVSVSWHEYAAASDDVLRDLARFADLVVMRGLSEKAPIDGDAMLEAVLFDAGRPILLVPGRPVDTLSGTALIAWDGAREAVHAVTSALPLLTRMETVRILTVDGDSGNKAEELAWHLAWHGIVASTHDAPAGSGSVGEAVLREAKEIDAGLLVMGGYHHSRAREILFGGTTRQIISTAKIPVLLAH